MSGTIWTERRVNEVASATRPSISEGEHVVVLDPSLSPDWLQMPNAPGVPHAIRGEQVRVEASVWFPLAPNPAAVPGDPETVWLEQRTRWHLLRCSGTYCVAEVAGHGWVLLEVGPARMQQLREVAGR